jgi:hypothetical protein
MFEKREEVARVLQVRTQSNLESCGTCLTPSPPKEYFREEVLPRVKCPTELAYTVDFAISPNNLESGRGLSISDVRIVELGHSFPTAGSALFDADLKADVQAMTSGEFELRVLSETPQNALSAIHESFQRFFIHVAPAHLRSQVVSNCSVSVEDQPSEGTADSKGDAHRCALM